MAHENQHDHISHISTMWTMLANAHGDETALINEAQNRIIEVYSGAVYRYLLGVLRDRDAADEVFQEFALRLMRGGFRHADRERGRFRDYLKTAVLRLVTDFYRRRGRRKPEHNAGTINDNNAPADEDPTHNFEAIFTESCREEFLARAWAALKLMQDESGQPFFSALDHRTNFSKATSEEMADALNAELSPEKPYTAAGIRKTLQRARAKFSDLLLYEVTQSLESHSLDDLEAELIELGLQPYCKSALDRRRAAS